MGHNSVVSGHLKSIGIPRVDGLSTGPPDLGRHKNKHDLTFDDVEPIKQVDGELSLPPFEPPLRRSTSER